jgi:hypothetical protein
LRIGIGMLSMRGIENWTAGLLRLILLSAALGLSGCALVPPEPEIEPDPRPEAVTPETEIEILPPPPAPAPKSRTSVAAPSLPTLAIVLTSSIAAYADVAAELSRRFENHAIYNLADDERAPTSILHSINDSDTGVVVAIGLRAARSAVALADRPVVFSQVFNYQELLTENTRGVSAIAPLDAQISAWKELNPSISRVGVIVGKGHDRLIEEARRAAETQDVELVVHSAGSDQETLFIFKRMIRKIDGFWLFADNRILSPRVLNLMIATAKQQQVPVLAPNESMLAIGASVSISSVAADIAETITQIVRRIEAGQIDTVPAISPLREIHVVSRDLTTRVADR